jgi:hypothetical protein
LVANRGLLVHEAGGFIYGGSVTDGIYENQKK